MAEEKVWHRDKRIRASALTMGQTFYLCTLNQFVGNNADAWPSQKTIASAMNATKRGVQKWQAELEAAGIIQVDVGKGRSLTNRYRLNLDALRPKPHANDEHSAPFRATDDEQMTNPVRPNDEHSAPEMTNTVRTERTVERTKKEHSVSEHFSDWYKIYPRKVGRPKAEASYRKSIQILTKRHQSQLVAVEWLNEVTSRFATSPAGLAVRFTPYPATWLNQGRYDDDQTEWANAGTTNGGEASGKSAFRSTWHDIVKACINIRMDDPNYPAQLDKQFGPTVGARIRQLKVRDIRTAADAKARGNDFLLKELEKRFAELGGAV